MYIAFDIETMRNDEMLHLMPDLTVEPEVPELKLGNIKDPAKIEQKKAEHKAKIATAERVATEKTEAAQLEWVDRMALNPLTGQIACAAFYCPEKEEVVFDEHAVLDKLWSILDAGHTIVTYNGKFFDLAFCFKRGMILGKSWATIPNMKRYCDRFRAVNHIDVMTEYASNGEKNQKLDFLLQAFLGEQKVDFDVLTIPEKMQTDEGREELAVYNMQDALGTYLLAQRMGLING